MDLREWIEQAKLDQERPGGTPSDQVAAVMLADIAADVRARCKGKPARTDDYLDEELGALLWWTLALGKEYDLPIEDLASAQAGIDVTGGLGDEEDDVDDLGKRLGSALLDHVQALGMSEREVIVRTGLSARQVRSLMSGTANPRLSVLASLCRSLSIDPAALLAKPVASSE